MKKNILKFAMAMVVIAGVNQVNAGDLPAPEAPRHLEIVVNEQLPNDNRQQPQMPRQRFVLDQFVVREPLIVHPKYPILAGITGAVIGGAVGIKIQAPVRGIALGGLLGTLSGTFCGAFIRKQQAPILLNSNPDGDPEDVAFEYNVIAPAATGFIVGACAATAFTPHILLSPLCFVGGGIAGTLANIIAMGMGSRLGKRLARLRHIG